MNQSHDPLAGWGPLAHPVPRPAPEAGPWTALLRWVAATALLLVTGSVLALPVVILLLVGYS